MEVKHDLSERYQNRMFRQVNSGFARRLQHRAPRRCIVLATLVNAASVGVVMLSAGDNPLWMGLAAVPYFLTAFLLNLSLGGIFELSDERLDEHQVGTRNGGYKTAYALTLVFLVVVVTTSSVLDLGRIETFAVAATSFLICALAPRLITAWIAEDFNEQD